MDVRQRKKSLLSDWTASNNTDVRFLLGVGFYLVASIAMVAVGILHSFSSGLGAWIEHVSFICRVCVIDTVRLTASAMSA
jgi:hypothetical protein